MIVQLDLKLVHSLNSKKNKLTGSMGLPDEEISEHKEKGFNLPTSFPEPTIRD